MSNKHKRVRQITVRAIRREKPDLRKLARALIELAQAQAEAEAQADPDAKQAAAHETPSKNEGQA